MAHFRACKGNCGKRTLKFDLCADCRASEAHPSIGTPQKGKACHVCEGMAWRRPLYGCTCGGAYADESRPALLLRRQA